MKLKTLKDLEIAGHEVVRAEAVKWVKEYDRPLAFIPEGDLSAYTEAHAQNRDNKVLVGFIMRFFNITYEDLK